MNTRVSEAVINARSGTLLESAAWVSPSPSWWGDARLLLVALWLGAALFSLVVAQVAFAVLPTRELAGALVGRTLAVLNMSGCAISLLLLATWWLGRSRAESATRRARLVEAVALVGLALATGVNQWVVTARLQALRAAMPGPVEALAKDDPLRVQFGALHGISVLVLGVGIIAAFVAFFAAAQRNRGAHMSGVR